MKVAQFLPLSSRERAQTLGKRFYFSGKPCGRGHVTLRCTVSNRCQMYVALKLGLELRRRKRFKPLRPEVEARLSLRRIIERSQRCDCCTNYDFARLRKVAKMTGLQIDHRVPLALGGPHCLRNLQLLSDFDHWIKTHEDLRQIARERAIGVDAVLRIVARTRKAWAQTLPAAGRNSRSTSFRPCR